MTKLKKILYCGGTGVVASALTTVSAFAADGNDSSTVITGITDGLTSGKTEFVTALAAISGIAIGFFVVKFVVKQGIKYFSTIANKG
ncbi:hypothetical protein [Clostridium butyricum]